MPIVADAAVAVRGDLSKFNNDLKGADKGIQGLGARLKGALTPTGILAGAGIAVGGAQVISFLGDAVGAAAEFQDTVSATGVIIGSELQPEMEKWAEAASTSFGASKQDALAAANQMAVFGKAAGLMGDDLVDFSTSMTQLGGDLASMFGGSTQDAITAVGAALRGESEPIRRYGVLLDDATLRQRAFEMGIIDTVSNALTPQQRVLAAQAEIMAQTADAQGDFARTSDGMANTQRILAAEFENVSIELGEKLLPIALDLALVFKDDLLPALSGLIELAGQVGGVFGTVGDAIDSVADAGVALHDFLFGANKDSEAYKEGVEEARVKLVEFQDSAYESYAAVQTAAAEGMAAARDATEREAFRIAAAVPDAVAARWADTRAAAFQMAIEHAKGILDGQNQVKVALEVLTQLQEEEETRAQRISYLQGVLSSAELAAGLNDGRPGVSGAARALAAQVRAELAGLGVNAYNSGYAVGSNVAAGIYASAHLADGATSYLAAKISGYLPRSEPKEGQLRGITKVGDAIVHSITDGIYGNIGHASMAANALAGALAPGVGMPGAYGVTGGGAGNTYVLQVDGADKIVGTRDEVLDAWAQMEQY